MSVMPIKTWERMGFTREDLIPTNLRLAAANRGAIYVAGRTPITVLHMGGRDLWMSFLVVENLDDADQFILGRDFVRNCDVMIDLNNGLIRIRNPDRKYVKRPINRIITDENKVPIFLDRKVKLQPGQAVVAIFRMRNLNSLSDSKQVCLVPNLNSQSSVILGRSFSVTSKISRSFEKLRDLLKRNADVFSHKADIGCCNFVEHEIELEEGAVPHREGARRMTPHKSEACRAEIEMLPEYDMIEPSKSPWACGVIMAKKKGGSLDFVATFVT